MKTPRRANNLVIALVAVLVGAPCAALIVVMGTAVLDSAINVLLAFGR